jgi:DNA-binding response OmpR family regulator
MSANILWVEGKRPVVSYPAFVALLENKGYTVTSVSTGKAAGEILQEGGAALTVVNAASMRSNGKRICLNLLAISEETPLILIVNPEHPPDEDWGVSKTLALPFTVRKLNNRIKELLPTESDAVLVAGEIRLDLKRHFVRCGEQESKLTPRLSKLLEMLMRSAGVVMERETLFREVWRTEYIADTRTLDVHISWLRKAIETNPRKPKHLKTIRGVGYRLDV